MRVSLRRQGRTANSKVLRTPLLAALGVFTIGLAVSFAAAQWIGINNLKIQQRRTTEQAEQLANQLITRVQSYEKGVRGARGAVLLGGLEHISRQTFQIYAHSRDIDEEFPGARGFGFIRRVPSAEMQAFLREARANIDADFSLRELSANNLERDVIVIIEPLAENAAAVGLDIASEAHRHAAALMAMRTGKAALTAPITIVQALDHPAQSFLLLLPVYKPGMPVDTIAQREAATVGWAYAPLLIDQVLYGLVSKRSRVNMHISDVTDPASISQFYRSAPFDQRIGPELNWRKAFSIFGRQWQVDIQPTAAGLAEMGLTEQREVVFEGSLASLLLAILVALVLLAKRRKGELSAQQQLLASVVANSTDAIVGESLDGLILSWNTEAERMFGYGAAEVVGQRLDQLILPSDRLHEDADILARSAKGERIQAFDTLRRRRDGSTLDVSITAAAILDHEGNIVGIYKTIRDIAAQKAAQRALEHRVMEQGDQLQMAERDLQTLLDALPSMISYWDKQLINRFANRAFEDWLGIDPKSLSGKHLEDCFGEQSYQGHRAHMETALGGKVVTFESSILGPNGKIRHALAHYLPDIRDGQVQGFYALVHDISELTVNKQRLEEMIRENDGLLGTLQLHSLVSIADRHGKIIYANDAFCELSGYTREELLGQDHRIVNSGFHRREFWQEMWRTFRTRKSWRGEVCNRAKDGNLYWVDSLIAPFFDAQGRIIKYVSIRTNITSAKRAQQRIAASEAFLERTGAVAGVGGFRIDLKTRSLTWTRQSYVIHDLDENTPLEPAVLTKMYTADAMANLQAAVNTTATTGNGFDLQSQVITGRGRSIWVRTVGQVEFDGDAPVAIVGAVQDITERKLAEVQLSTSNERLKLATKSAGMGVWEWELPSNTLRWDTQMYALYGVTDSQDVEPYTRWSHALHSEDRARVHQEVEVALKGEAALDTEFRIQLPHGETRYIRAAAVVIYDANGKPERMTGVNFDITKRKQAEKKLRDTSMLLSNVLNAASEISMIATQPDLTIKVFNRGSERLLGYTAEEVVDKVTPILIHDVDEVQACADRLTKQLGKAVVGGDVFIEPSMMYQPHEWTYIRKDGKRVPVSLVVTPMLDAAGELTGYLGIASDITQSKQQAQSLLEATARAENANAAKSQFLANMSHEIRTPLNAVIGVGYLLEQTTLNNDQRSLLNKIQFAGRSLLSVVNNVLDISKIEAGEMTLEEAPFDLRQLVREIGQMLSPQAQGKGIELLINTAADMPRLAQGDATRLRQILINLLNNSIKFTEAGHVELRISCVERDANTVRLRCAVLDTGIGIEPEVLKRLFTPFTQADTSTTRRFGGTGLGLSIARRLTELMGGDIGVSSTVGVGSEFWLEVPLRLPAERSEPISEAGVRNLSLLIVEPREHQYEITSAARSLGWQVHAAESSEEVLRLLHALPLTSWPDAIVTCTHVQDVDAQQLIALIKQEFTHAGIPPFIVAVDGQHSSMDAAALQQVAGMTLRLPATNSDLFNAVNKALAQHNDKLDDLLESTNFDQMNAQWLPELRVLVVDDSDINREVAQRILQKQGASVTTCNDGSAAVECLRAQPDAFDVVLMDVQMPNMDGNTAVQCIRDNLGLRELPVIALTAGALVSERQRAMDAGMNAFLTKPFDPLALIRVVRRQVELVRGKAVPIVVVDKESAAAPVAAMSGLTTIDVRAVQRMYGDDTELFKSLLARVVHEYTDFALPIVLEGSDAGARRQLKSRSHKFKGSAAVVGATTVHRYAGAVERALDDGQPNDFVEAILRELAAAFTALREEARSLLKDSGEPQLIADETQAVADEQWTEAKHLNFLAMLDTHNLDVLDCIKESAGALRRCLGDLKFGELQEAVDNLDFSLAAELLRGHSASTQAPQRSSR